MLYMKLDKYASKLTHLDDLGELHRLLGGVLEVINGENLEARLVELQMWLA